MIRALIVDDEPLSRRTVRQLLRSHADVEIAAECADGEAARTAMDTLDLDLVFLDVRMPELSGLDVARARTEGTRPFIVFVTAFDEFALPAFDAEATDYLTKPLTQERFDIALARVRRMLARPDRAVPQIDRLVARVRDRDVFIAAETVDYIAADDVYVVVHS
ncbi:MAG TPA: response regulator, partial [Gemmatimonadaceae bacterium]|nr:response regulator [Gemmatimonadaceae bacterium]